jgi:hypothetical protein
MNLVDRDDVKTALRIDCCDDDDRLDLLIGAASRAVVNYLKGQAATVLDVDDAAGDSPPTVPDEVQHATILLVDYYHRGDFEGADPGAAGTGNSALLYAAARSGHCLMPRVRFLQKFDYHVPGRAGDLGLQAWRGPHGHHTLRSTAIAAGKAVAFEKEQPNEAGSEGG